MSTNNEGTPTPLTDAQMARQLTSSLSWGSRDAYELADFARQLERSLTATKQRLEVAEKGLTRTEIITAAHFLKLGITSDDVTLIERVAGWAAEARSRAALHPSADKAESNEDQP